MLKCAILKNSIIIVLNITSALNNSLSIWNIWMKFSYSARTMQLILGVCSKYSSVLRSENQKLKRGNLVSAQSFTQLQLSHEFKLRILET